MIQSLDTFVDAAIVHIAIIPPINLCFSPCYKLARRTVQANMESTILDDLLESLRVDDVGVSEPGWLVAAATAPAAGILVELSAGEISGDSKTQSIPPLMWAWNMGSRQISMVCPKAVYHILPLATKLPCSTVVPFVAFMPFVPVLLPRSSALSRYQAIGCGEPCKASEPALLESW